ncbi:MAG: hypothetical protein NC410_10630 [Oscillibacter sp.]|nr:hypothetical protein [Oscillibacter sp.]
MIKKVCVVIALIAICYWACCSCFVAYESSRWVREEEVFCAVLMVINAVLMFIGCVKIFADDVKTTTVLFSIASVLFFIGSIVFISKVINRGFYQNLTGEDVGLFLGMNGPVIVPLIVYALSKSPEKRRPQEIVSSLVNVEITEEDRERYAAQIAKCSMYELRVYVFDKKGTYAPALAALALEEIREREAGHRTRVTETEA